GQGRAEALDVARRLTHEISDLEGIADVHDIDALDRPRGGRDVDPGRSVVPGRDVEARAPHLAETENDDGSGGTHDRDPPAAVTETRRPVTRVDSRTRAATRCCCSGESPGNIGSESTWSAARAETGGE